MATAALPPVTPASGPTLDEIRNPERTRRRRLAEAEGEAAVASTPQEAKPDPNYYKFFGGGKPNPPGAESDLIRIMRERDAEIERQKQRDRLLQMQQR